MYDGFSDPQGVFCPYCDTQQINHEELIDVSLYNYDQIVVCQKCKKRFILSILRDFYVRIKDGE